MISTKHRFHGHNSLRYVYQNGRTVRGPLSSIKSVINDRRSTYRLAVVVSKKISKSAVVRNRIRRRLYEAVRHIEDNIAEPYDIVITVFHEQLGLIPHAEVTKLVSAQFKQAGITSVQKKTPRPAVK